MRWALLQEDWVLEGKSRRPGAETSSRYLDPWSPLGMNLSRGEVVRRTEGEDLWNAGEVRPEVRTVQRNGALEPELQHGSWFRMTSTLGHRPRSASYCIFETGLDAHLSNLR